MKPLTLFEKIWDQHAIHRDPGKPDLLYIDLHLIHEVTSPQAFEGLRPAQRKIRRPDLALATVDHAIPTTDRDEPWTDPLAIKQVETLERNCRESGIPFLGAGDPRQGIVHVVGPEQGLTQPGMTIVCGDSHTATHGAFGALAFGIGTSEVEHVLATQTLSQQKPKTMAVVIDGELTEGVSAKDLILAIIHTLGVSGGAGHVIEYQGSTLATLSMEGRMTLCNMSIEAGARAGLIAPDDNTFEYLKGRPYAPQGNAWEEAVEHWQTLATDSGAEFDHTVRVQAGNLEPRITWGTTPAMNVGVSEKIPHPEEANDEKKEALAWRALEYMDLEPGTAIKDIPIDRVFIGSCTNGRIEDLRAAARVIRGQHVAKGVKAMVVPGTGLVKARAESENLDLIFRDAGFEWRDPGCSMCLAMNSDRLERGERCASTSNRNFEGRQGPGGRTHLVSPAMAAAAAVAGCFVDVREVK